MTAESSSRIERRFVPNVLPWVVGAAALALYLITLNHWVTLNNLTLVSRVNGWIWQPLLMQPPPAAADEGQQGMRLVHQRPPPRRFVDRHLHDARRPGDGAEPDPLVAVAAEPQKDHGSTATEKAARVLYVFSLRSEHPERQARVSSIYRFTGCNASRPLR